MALHSWGKPPIGIDELELSSVTNLYANGNLDASIATPSKLQPSAKINDMVILVQRDLTRLTCDAIVNAANKSLLGGGGIDGAIHNVAGHDLYKECLHLNGCKTGEAKITKGYKLPATHVIHTVGPVYWTYKDNGEDPAVWLKSCYVASLDVARKNGCKTVAFPCISTGIYGYPNREAAIVACKAVREYLDAQEAEDAETEKKDNKEEVVENKIGDVKGEEEEGGVKLTLEDKENVEKEKSSTVDAPAGPSAPAADTSTAGDTEKTDDKKEEGVEEKPFLTKIEKVIFCTFLDKDLAAYDNIVPAFFPPVEGMEGSLKKLSAEAAETKAEEGAAEKPEDKPEVKFETEEKVETKAEGTN